MVTRAGIARLKSLVIAGPAGNLEALLQAREPEVQAITAVVCHPHPLYGGTMHNKVVHRVAAKLADRGAIVLRFNFRGVGKSDGSFDQGEGELDDARAALGYLREHHPAARRWVAGFSFGAWVAARLAASEADVEQLILVAPPVTRLSFEFLNSLQTPKLVIQGQRDVVCPPEALDARFAVWSEPKRLILVDGATHFFDRQLAALSEALDQGLPRVA